MERFMPLQQYVQQLRPRTESYTPHVDRIQNILTETVGSAGLVYELKVHTAMKTAKDKTS